MGTVMSVTHGDAGDGVNAKGVESTVVRQGVSRQRLFEAYVACAVRGGYSVRPEECTPGLSVVLSYGLAIKTASYLLVSPSRL